MSSGKDATASRMSACTEALLPYICAPVTRRATMATLSSALPSKIVPLLLGPQITKVANANPYTIIQKSLLKKVMG